MVKLMQPCVKYIPRSLDAFCLQFEMFEVLLLLLLNTSVLYEKDSHQNGTVKAMLLVYNDYCNILNFGIANGQGKLQIRQIQKNSIIKASIRKRKKILRHYFTN